MADKKRTLPEAVMNNLLLKLLAVGLAILTIGIIRRLTSQEEEFEIPITVRVAPGAAILDQDARTAYITCSGSVEDLRRVDARTVRIIATPKFGGAAGTEQVPIGPRDVEGWLRGVTVKRVRPDLVTVTFDTEIESQVAVAKPDIIGEPRIGRAEVEHTPRFVTVRGPESRILDMSILRTEPVDVTGAVDAFTAQLKVLTEGDQWTYEITPARVTARVNIVTESISRVWTNRPVRAMLDRARGQTVTLLPDTVDVTVRGSPEMVETLSAQSVTAFIDGTGLQAGSESKLEVQVHLPPGVEVSTATQPKTITVTLLEAPPPEPEPEPEPETEAEREADADEPETEA